MTEPTARSRRRLPAWQFYALLVAAIAALALAAELLGGVDDSDDLAFHPWFVAALLLVSGVATLLVWRRLDEAAREAHKWAWYWGGSAGMVAVLAMFLLGDSGFALAARAGLSNSFEDGVVAVLSLEVIGYLVAWIYWWLRRR